MSRLVGRAIRSISELIYPASLYAQGLRWVSADDVFPLSKNYDSMSRIMSETGWGHLFMFSAAIFAALILTDRPKLRRFSLLACGSVWFFVGVSILISNQSASFAFPLIFLGVSSVAHTLVIPRVSS